MRLIAINKLYLFNLFKFRRKHTELFNFIFYIFVQFILRNKNWKLN